MQRDNSGSEKWHPSASENSEKYSSEIGSINKSLSALTNCVQALAQRKNSHVQFRDSKLTRLLQSCLQGKSRTTFIVTLSPSRDFADENLATLRFAERLKCVICQPIRKKIISDTVKASHLSYYEDAIQEMRVKKYLNIPTNEY